MRVFLAKCFKAMDHGSSFAQPIKVWNLSCLKNVFALRMHLPRKITSRMLIILFHNFPQLLHSC